MKKYFYFLSVIAMAMLAVSCDNIEGDNPNEDIPEIIDPFLGDIVPNDYTTNQENFAAFTDVLLHGCYQYWSWYQKIDGNWTFTDWAIGFGGNGLTCFLMIDSETLLKYTTNPSLGPDLNVPKFTKYTVAYDAETGTIYTTEILPDGTNDVTHSGKLLSGAPRFVTEGEFCGQAPMRTVVDGNIIYWEIRWCFKECNTKRAELLEKYAKWLSEQEQE